MIALGADGSGPTRLFSETTAALLTAMQEAGVRRFVAVTGVGAARPVATAASSTTA